MHMRRHRTLLIIVGVIVVLLIAARLALPSVMERTIERQIAHLDNVQGGVAKVRLSLWRGVYEVDGTELWHRPQGKESLHVKADRAVMNVSWLGMLRGQLTGDVLVDSPHIDITLAGKKVVPPEAEFDLARTLQALFPFRIDGALVRNGTVTFRTDQVAPVHALKLEGLNARVRNITNAKKVHESSFATFSMVAKVQGSAPLILEGHLNPTAHTPTFDTSMTLRDLSLANVNPWLEQYAKAKAQSGTFATRAELTAANGSFNGYISPKTSGLEMTSVEEHNALQKLWAGLVEWVGKKVANNDEPRPERIPIDGEIANPDAGILPAMTDVTRSALVSAFIQSLAPGQSGSHALKDASVEPQRTSHSR
jgi:hypothetical protein